MGVSSHDQLDLICGVYTKSGQVVECGVRSRPLVTTGVDGDPLPSAEMNNYCLTASRPKD